MMTKQAGGVMCQRKDGFRYNRDFKDSQNNGIWKEIMQQENADWIQKQGQAPERTTRI